jgi:isopropylmalate/homocitrate/citramalate synthase
MMRYPSNVTVVEVGPRDGLQNEAVAIPADDKVNFVDRLSAAGLPVIEAGAFVSPKWVPQMADTSDVFRGIARRAGTRYTAIVPNLEGLERAHASCVDEVGIIAAASDTFSLRNINQDVDASLDTYRAVCARASELHVRVRGYVSTAFGCPFEGEVPPARVASVAEALMNMGAFEVAISDTIGIAHPGRVRGVIAVIAERVPLHAVALHFHDTRGTALANVLTALELGISTFDASAGGLGGCPYAPGATGNLATEDLLYMLDGLGIDTGVSLDKVLAASRFIEQKIGHPLASRYATAVRAASSRTSRPPSS